MHPTAGRRSKYKSLATREAEEAVESLQPPILPEYLKGDDADGPSGSEEEKDAKRLRSTSTTPGSGRGTDPDDYDQGVANDSGVSTPLASGSWCWQKLEGIWKLQSCWMSGETERCFWA